MTIEMTLAELDFPTPDVTEAWEATPAEVAAFVDWMDAETAHKNAVNEWVAAEIRYERKRCDQLSLEYMQLTLTSPERCYCSPSRGMMFDPWHYDIYNPGGHAAAGYARMNADLEAQIEYLKAENAARAEVTYGNPGYAEPLHMNGRPYVAPRRSRWSIWS